MCGRRTSGCTGCARCGASSTARASWRPVARWHGCQTTVCFARELGLRGVVRGRRLKTTTSVSSLLCPADRVNRVFRATRPNALWLADLTYVATWVGFVYVAFVIDAFARRIVGWRVSNSLRTDLALDALEQALYDRAVGPRDALVHHEDRGSQYLSIRYTERLAQAGIEQSVGSVGDSYDNALAVEAAKQTHHRAVQGGTHPPTWPVARPGAGGVRDARMGRLVQQPTHPRADRKLPTGRGRNGVLSPPGTHGPGRVTHTKQSPVFPGRFSNFGPAHNKWDWAQILCDGLTSLRLCPGP